MRKRSAFFLCLSLLLVLFSFSLGKSFADTNLVDTEEECELAGARCFSRVGCPGSHPVTVGSCGTGITCCKNNSYTCLNNVGYRCEETIPSNAFEEAPDLTCRDSDDKCWRPKEVFSTCTQNGGSCKTAQECTDDGGHIATGTCTEQGDICCRPNQGGSCQPSGERCVAGGCGDCYYCKKLGELQYACTYKTDCCGAGVELPPPIEDIPYTGPKITSYIDAISYPAKFLYYAGLFIGLSFIVYSGYILMTSEGDPGRTQEGKEHLTAAILGTAFILLSSAILRVIINSLLGGGITI